MKLLLVFLDYYYYYFRVVTASCVKLPSFAKYPMLPSYLFCSFL